MTVNPDQLTSNEAIFGVFTDIQMHLFVSNNKGQLIFIMVLKWISSSFRPNLIFPILMAQMKFSQIQQASGPDFRKVRKHMLYKHFQLHL